MPESINEYKNIKIILTKYKEIRARLAALTHYGQKLY